MWVTSSSERTNKKQETKSRRPTSLPLTCIIVVGGEKQGGEKQGNASVSFLVFFCEFVPILFLSICVVYCSSGWLFGSHLPIAGVKS